MKRSIIRATTERLKICGEWLQHKKNAKNYPTTECYIFFFGCFHVVIVVVLVVVFVVVLILMLILILIFNLSCWPDKKYPFRIQAIAVTE